LTKVPYRADRPDLPAASNRPDTWSNHAEAVAAVEAGRADGIGFMLQDSDIAAFDLDDCRDPETGEIAPWAWELVNTAQSYTEVTVSGTGLRIIGHGTGTPVHCNRPVPHTDGKAEIYRRATRFIVVTGLQLPDTCDTLANIDSVIDITVQQLTGKGQQATAPIELSTELPPELDALIRDGAPVSTRSEKFFHVVGWLKDVGYSVDEIERLLSAFPNGIAAKYRGRLRSQIEDCYCKAENKNEPKVQVSQQTVRPPTIELHWHGEADPDEDREWLIEDLIPKEGKGLASGQFATGKTFIGLDLGASVMMGEPFAGRRVARRGGVLFIAPEGASEIRIRLKGIVEHKLRPVALAQSLTGTRMIDLERLPFAWITECPPLVDNDTLSTLSHVAREAAARMEAQFGVPLALIVIDTVAASSGVTDENAAAENHRVMAALEGLSKETGAFVLGVDHFGKAVETGTRGSSAKEAAADVILAMLGERAPNGTVSNTRMAVRKLRGGATGAETRYSLQPVSLGENQHGQLITTCVVSWDLTGEARADAAPKRERWTKALKVFRKALDFALIEDGELFRPFGSEGPEVRGVAEPKVRDEFIVSYPAGGETSDTSSDAKRKAYKRALDAALAKGLVVSRERGGIDFLWLTDDRNIHGTDRTLS
jgi:hypothetical protein